MGRMLFRMAPLLALAATACSGALGEEEQKEEASAARSAFVVRGFCAATCERRASCAIAVEGERECVPTCMKANERALSRIREDVVSSARACMETVDCGSVRAGTSVRDCFVEATSEKSAASRHICAMFDDAYAVCGASLDLASCIDDATKYTDTALAEAQGCAQKPCAEISTCIKKALPAPFSL